MTTSTFSMFARETPASARAERRLFYWTVVTVCRPPFFVSSRPLHLHVDRLPRDGAFILACSHLSPYDVPALMRSSPRPIDFVSTTEVFANPFVAWLYGHMGTFPLDRGRSDPKTVRIILDRLTRGRCVGMFPEGRIRKESESVINGGRFRPTLIRLAKMANVPIVPVVVWGAERYKHVASWLPLMRTKYGVIYGEPFFVDDEEKGERQLAQDYQRLFVELRTASQPQAPGDAAPAAAADSPLRAVYSENMPSSR
jgi:1-acyl-sn-glycerol-3-phosphate acyltransferase